MSEGSLPLAPRRRTVLPREALLSACGLGTALFLTVLAIYAALRSSNALNESVLRKTDFLQFYAVGRLIMDGHGGAIFVPRVLAQLEMSIQHVHAAMPTVLPYLDLPYFAVLVAPLGRLPYLHAYTTWLAVNCLMLAGTLTLLLQHAGIRRALLPVAAIAVLLCPPIAVALLQGQVSIVLLTLVAIVVVAACLDLDRTAGAALALALLKPPFALPLLLVFVLRRRWRAVRWFAIVLFLELLLPCAVLGISVSADYVHLLANVWRWQGHTGHLVYQHVSIASTTYSTRDSSSMAGIVWLVTPTHLASAVGGACDLLLLAGLAWYTLRDTPLDAALGIGVLVSLLISPHVLVHDLSVLLVPMAIAWKYRQAGQVPAGYVLALAYTVLFVGFLLSFTLPFQLSMLATLILLAWMATALPGGADRAADVSAA